ncbi:hypothetical protein JW935_17340 [candidate division KSB1 bacterium]|nr:hypothetical protein [candidate division KSB1 bacterium]
MKSKIVFFTFLTIYIVFTGCSKDQNPLPSKSHSDKWIQKESPDFHGKKVMACGSQSCKSCHGTDFCGGENGTACFKCHPSYPHPEWAWRDHSSSDFHGQYVIDQEWDINPCANCHGQEYDGGRTNLSCYKCHGPYPHRSGWMTKENTVFHGRFIRNVNWSMNGCKSCHGADYQGGKSGCACTTCHAEKNGPEACTVCHGSSNNPAPPQDLHDNTETTRLGVGAHQLHYEIYGNCTICHKMPESFSDPGHIDRTPLAEVNSNRSWDREKATCEKSCHFDPKKSYIWNNFTTP